MWKIFCALPLNEHLKLVESYYFKDLDITCRGMEVADGIKQIPKTVAGPLK